MLDEGPKAGSTNVWSFSRALLPGARNFLNTIKHNNEFVLSTALKLYESDSESEMLESCNVVLHALEVSLNKSKNVSRPEFFAICVLDMVSRASEMATNHLSTPSEKDNIRGITYPSPGIFFRRSKTLEILFGLVRPTSIYNPFEAISKTTCSKEYDRNIDGTDLLSYVESCLFKIKPLSPRPPQNAKSLQIDLPSAPGKTSMNLVAPELPDRSTPELGRKRGLSAESESQGQKSRAASRQRLPISAPRVRDTESNVESHSGGEDKDHI